MSKTRYNDAVANSLGEAIGFRARLTNLKFLSDLWAMGCLK